MKYYFNFERKADTHTNLYTHCKEKIEKFTVIKNTTSIRNTLVNIIMKLCI